MVRIRDIDIVDVAGTAGTFCVGWGVWELWGRAGALIYFGALLIVLALAIGWKRGVNNGIAPDATREESTPSSR